ncbi:hypothetical protein [Streptomyces griseorubiginosus]|uniref:hypothetical protein n=1 Tax=Streptomyces griseorubiginosus TaxID=67304 RepID=UPI000AFF4A3E|nr:hypothetical protein [Streptomyces griseorubiginosus]
MQMSSTEFFAYVEGSHTDGYVHGTNCDMALTSMKVSYEVIPANRLPGAGNCGGKSRLKSFYEELRQAGALSGTFQGKTTVVVFFMDKDVDDAVGTLISSDHIIYTDFYDVENHVFHEGDVASAVASACSLPPNWCRATFGAAGLWQANAARNWIDWVKLCYTSKVSRVATEANYGRPSPINNPPYSPVDSQGLQALERKLHAKIRTNSNGSCADWVSSRQAVENLYGTNQWDRVFKGKWYAHILAAEVTTRAPYPIDTKHLAVTLAKQVAGTMKFNSTWVKQTCAKITNLAAAAGLPNSP